MLGKLGNAVLKKFGFNDFAQEVYESEGVAQTNNYLKNHSLSQIFVYETYDESRELYINRRNVGFVFETDPLVGSDNNIDTQFASLFQTTLPELSNIQFLLIADPYIGNVLENYCQPRRQQSELFGFLAEKRKQYLENLSLKQGKIGGQDIALRQFRCFISVTIPTDDPIEDLQAPSIRPFLDNVAEIRDKVHQAFYSVKMSVNPLLPHDLMVLVDDLVHPRYKIQNLKHSKLDWNPHQSISSQVPTGFHSLSVKRQGLYINEDEHVMRFYSVHSYPRQWMQAFMTNLIGDPFKESLQINCPFYIHYGVHIPAQNKLKINFYARANHVERQVTSPYVRYIPDAVEEAKEHQFVRQQLAEGHRFVKTNLTIGILSEPQKLNRNDQAIKDLFKANQWEIEAMQCLHMQALTAMMPMAWSNDAIVDLHNTKKLKQTASSESANILSIQGEWKGSHTPDMLLVGRRGEIITWSPWNHAENFNVAVVGQSGSGKSVFMQELLCNLLGQGAKCFVIDIGRSFYKLAKILGGDIIQFSVNTDLRLNPFTDIDTSDPNEINEALHFVKNIICNMAGLPETDKTGRGIIEQAVQAVWQEKQNCAEVTDIAQFLKVDKNARSHELALALHTYTRNGLCGKYFCGKANVTFKNQLTIIELEELKSNPSLQKVILQMLSAVITNQIFKGKREQKHGVIMDEAAGILSDNSDALFADDLARRVRKYDSCLITGTQNLSDFYRSPAALAAYQNSYWQAILSQKPDVVEEVTRENNVSGVTLNINRLEKKQFCRYKPVKGNIPKL